MTDPDTNTETLPSVKWPWAPAIIARDLNALPFVKWDRYVNDGEWCALYGWIERPDGRADFVILIYTPEGRENYTSSAELSAAIDYLFGETGEHNDCGRIEDAFCDVVRLVDASASADDDSPRRVAGARIEGPSSHRNRGNDD